jgi:glucuronosyltransferase
VMDRAVNGIIFFSLGGNIKSSDLPPEKLEVFLKIFASMSDVLVLWKFESVALKDRHANNIIIGPWMPQQEILKHKNLKVFITHGGLLSSMEALYYGKPIIGIPFFNDQKFNMARAVSQGYGMSLDYDSLSEESLGKAIKTIFNDTSYQTSAEKLSELFRDNPIKPVDKAVYYVEHVIRNGGAAHLKTAATKLSFIQIHLVDQILFVLLAITSMILIAIFALSTAMKWLKKKFQKRGKSGTIKSSKRNKFKSN